MTELPSGTVTFLFTDIEGSTQLLQQLREKYAGLLADHHRILRASFEKYGGQEVDTQGDSFFFAFSRASDGVFAAVEAQKRLVEHTWPDNVEVRVRMGLHTGEPWEAEDGYVGLDVHRAARIAHVGHGGQTLLSQTTLDLVQDNLPEDIELLDLGEQPLEGLMRPEHIYQLTAPGLPAEFLPLKRSGGVEKVPAQLPAFLLDEEIEIQRPVFVAREGELEKLNTLLERVLDGNGQVAFVRGGPGRGKSALLGEFSRSAMDGHPQMLVASGYCNAYAGVGDPYLPFREVMNTLCGDVESEWRAGAITTVHARRLWSALPQTVAALLDYGPHILGRITSGKYLLGRAEFSLPDDGQRLYQLRKQVSQQLIADDIEQSHLFEQYTNVLRTLSGNHPLILVLDDLQWADNASIGLLFHLGRRLEGCRILIVGAYRPEEVSLGREGERHPLEKILREFKRDFGDMIVDLAAGNEREDRHFVDALLASEPNRLGEQFNQTLFERTGGHPLFTVELLRTIQERGDLVQEDGAWVQRSSLDWEMLPVRIEAVIEERIDRLSDELREILMVASVEGVNFTAQVVRQVQQVSEREILRTLSQELEKRHRLVRAGVEFQVGAHHLSRYRFAHALFQQYLYNGLSNGERRLLHREVGTALENMYQGRLEEIAVQLAHHFRDEPERERRYARLAGEQAASRFANSEALQYFSRALLHTGEADLAGRHKLLMAREAVYNLLGERDAQRKDLEELRQLSGLLDDPAVELGRAEVETRWARYSQSDYQGTALLAEQAVSLAISEGKPEVAAQAYRIWSDALLIRGEHDSAIHQANLGISIARDISDLRGECRGLSQLGLITLAQGDPTKAKVFLEQSLTIAREIEDHPLEAPPLNSLGNAAGIEGDYTAAQGYYQQALKIVREVGNRPKEGVVLTNLGWVASIQGDYNTAESFYKQALQIAGETGDRHSETYAFINLCNSTLTKGDVASAMEYAEQGLTLAGDTGDRSGEAWALTFVGHVCLEMDDYNKAVNSYQAALDIRRSLDQLNLAMEPLAGLAWLSLKREKFPAAQVFVGEILDHLDSGGTLDGAEEPLRVWLTCYQVLLAVNDPRAESVLHTAHELLQRRATEISDDTLRRSFLENIPYHMKIVTAWKEYQIGDLSRDRPTKPPFSED